MHPRKERVLIIRKIIVSKKKFALATQIRKHIWQNSMKHEWGLMRRVLATVPRRGKQMKNWQVLNDEWIDTAKLLMICATDSFGKQKVIEIFHKVSLIMNNVKSFD